MNQPNDISVGDGSILYTWKNQLIVVVTPPEWAADRRWKIHTT